MTTNDRIEAEIQAEAKRIEVFFQSAYSFSVHGSVRHKLAVDLASHLVRNRIQVQDAHVLALVAALRELAALTGQTLLGGRSEPDPRRAHEDGANKAFEQCARIALTALKAAGEDA